MTKSEGPAPQTAAYPAEGTVGPIGAGPLLPATGVQSGSLRRQVFEHVRAAGRAGRAGIGRSIGVSAASITSASAELIAAGYLAEVEAPLRDSGRGRPPVALEVVAGNRHVIGIKLSDEQHTAVVTDFAGQVVAEAALPTPPVRKSLDQLLAETAELVRLVLESAGLEIGAISGLGLGLSGLVDSGSGVIPWSPLLAEPDQPLGPEIARLFGLPVHLDNDANLLTLAELWFGAGRARSDFILVTIEQGVGMGLVLNNRLFRGTRGLGMELGHTKLRLDGALCRCGQRGCLEAYLADYALAREAATALDRNPRNPASPRAMLEVLYSEAKAGNLAAQSIFHRAGRYLAMGLANIVQIFDPELIILSGGRMKYDYLYAGEVLEEMRALTLDRRRPPPRVEIQSWDDLVWARGAAALALAALTEAELG